MLAVFLASALTLLPQTEPPTTPSRAPSRAGATAGPGGAEAASPPPGGAAAQGLSDARFVDEAARFAVALPSGWRRLTPDEGRTLRAGGNVVPAEFLEPEPPRFLVFGPIDRWLAGSFDGRALTFAETDGEPEVGPNGVAQIEAHWAAMAQRGMVVVTERLQPGTVGAEAHPALLGRLRVGTGGDAHSRFDAYVPSGGQTYCFALTWPTADAAAGEARFAEICQSIGVAAKARGPVSVGSKLLWAALLGLLIGAVLHAVRKRARG